MPVVAGDGVPQYMQAGRDSPPHLRAVSRHTRGIKRSAKERWNQWLLRRIAMNLSKLTYRRPAAFVAAMAVLTLTGAAIPAQAQTPTIVYAFPGQPGPSNPNIEAIAQGRDGNLYLTAAGGNGGAANCTVTYCGEAFFITPSGSVTDVFDFSNNSCPGAFCGNGAYGGLTLGTDGNYYGATQNGGTTGNNGTVFKLTPAGVATALYNFTGASDGSHPYGSPIQGTDGNFYGSTYAGGTAGAGVIFKITTGGTYTVLHNINGTTDENGPWGSLVQATDGKLYGITSNIGIGLWGTIFSVTTSGTFTTLYSFTGSTDGGNPLSPLRQHTNGLLYGTTNVGGDVNNCTSVVYINGQPTLVLGCGLVYSLNIGKAAFASLVSTSGKEGAKIGILGDRKSVV